MGRTGGRGNPPRRVVRPARTIVLLTTPAIFFFLEHSSLLLESHVQKPGRGFQSIVITYFREHSKTLKVVQSFIFLKILFNASLRKIQGSAHHPEPFAPAFLSCHARSRRAGRDEKPCGTGRETDNQAYCMVVYRTSWIAAEMVTVCCRTTDLISAFDNHQCSHDTWGRGGLKNSNVSTVYTQKRLFLIILLLVLSKKLKCLEFFICGPLECNQWEL